MPDDFDRLREIERKSEEWYKWKRPQQVFFTQCGDYRDQEKREDEIDRLRRKFHLIYD